MRPALDRLCRPATLFVLVAWVFTVCGAACPADTDFGSFFGTPNANSSDGNVSGAGLGGGSGGVDDGGAVNSNDNGSTGGSDDGSDNSTDNGSGDDDGTDDDAGTVDDQGFTVAWLVHWGAGGFLADSKINLPAEADFNVDGSIETAVQLARVTKDGSRVWFATQDYNGFVEPQVFCINSDGSGIQEFAVPTGFHSIAREISPSGTGDSCVVLYDVNSNGVSSGYISSASVILLIDRASGQQTVVYDGRNIDTYNDFQDLQLTDDGLTVFFREVDTGIIYSIGVSGGSPTVVATPGDFFRSGSSAIGPVRFRVTGDGTALAAIIRFDAHDGTYPTDLYVKNGGGFSGLTATGDIDWYNTSNGTDLGISDDGLMVLYGRYDSDASVHHTYTRYVGGGEPVELSTIYNLQRSFGMILDPGRSVVLTGWGMPGDPVEAQSLFAPDGTSKLEYLDGWISNWVGFTSMSHGGGVLVGTWRNGAFGDPGRLYAWFPGQTQFRSGPTISTVRYKHDATADTLEVRVAVNGSATSVRLFGFKNEIESYYTDAIANGYETDPFFDERFGSDMALTEEAGVYALTIDLEGVPLTSDYRIRIGVANNDTRDFAYADFRPTSASAETADENGDGKADD